MNEFLDNLTEEQIEKLKQDACQFNLFVLCPPERHKKCHRCGWNPRIEKQRKARIKERMKLDVY